MTTKVRAIGETRTGLLFIRNLLAHKRAMLYFTQASTRTFLSFLNACQILGMQCAEIRDPSVSSEAKGESPLDSMTLMVTLADLKMALARP